MKITLQKKMKKLNNMKRLIEFLINYELAIEFIPISSFTLKNLRQIKDATKDQIKTITEEENQK